MICKWCHNTSAPGEFCEHCRAKQNLDDLLPNARLLAGIMRERANLMDRAADTIERLCDRVEALEGMLEEAEQRDRYGVKTNAEIAATLRSDFDQARGKGGA